MPRKITVSRLALAVIGIAVLAGAGYWWWLRPSPPPPAVEAGPPTRPVRTMTLGPAESGPVRSFPGRVQSGRGRRVDSRLPRARDHHRASREDQPVGGEGPAPRSPRPARLRDAARPGVERGGRGAGQARRDAGGRSAGGHPDPREPARRGAGAAQRSGARLHSHPQPPRAGRRDQGRLRPRDAGAGGGPGQHLGRGERAGARAGGRTGRGHRGPARAGAAPGGPAARGARRARRHPADRALRRDRGPDHRRDLPGGAGTAAHPEPSRRDRPRDRHGCAGDASWSSSAPET